MTSTESVPRANIPAAPLKLKEHPKPLARRMYAVLDAAVEEARESYDVIYRYKVGKAHETEALNTATTDEAVTYRKAVAQHAERVAEYKKDYEAEIAEFVKKLNERTKLADESLKKYEDAARTSINLENGVTAEENIQALENYKAVADMVKGVMTTLAKQGVELQFSLPSVVSGKKGDGSRGFTPRFSSIVINGTPLDGSKLMDLVNKIEVKREFIIKRIENAVGGSRDGWDALDPESAVNFTVDDNGKVYDITVTKAAPTPRKTKSADGSLTEAPAEDDDDEEEEEEDE